jgi:hypothetical protein
VHVENTEEGVLPAISAFFGIIIYMHWRDHAPPHFHAHYQGHEALYEILTGEVLAGSLPRKADKIVREWLSEHELELIENWNRGERREAFEKVPGADVE